MKRILAAILAIGLAGAAGTALAADAAATYKAKCAACHGADGKKKGDLTAVKGSDADVARTIADGIPAKKMPAYKGKLSDEEIQGVAKYVKNGLK